MTLDEKRRVVIKSLNEIIGVLQDQDSAALEIEGVKDLNIEDYRSKGYRKPARIREVERARLKKLDFEAPPEPTVQLLKELVEYIKADAKPPKPKIQVLLEKLTPYVKLSAEVVSLLRQLGWI